MARQVVDIFTSLPPVAHRSISIRFRPSCTPPGYNESSHLRTSLCNGLHTSNCAPVQKDSATDYWNAEERPVLRATGQLLVQPFLDDDQWQALMTFRPQPQIIDLLLPSAPAALLYMATNTLGAEGEDELRQLAACSAAPV